MTSIQYFIKQVKITPMEMSETLAQANRSSLCRELHRQCTAHYHIRQSRMHRQCRQVSYMHAYDSCVTAHQTESFCQTASAGMSATCMHMIHV